MRKFYLPLLAATVMISAAAIAPPANAKVLERCTNFERGGLVFQHCSSGTEDHTGIGSFAPAPRTPFNTIRRAPGAPKGTGGEEVVSEEKASKSVKGVGFATTNDKAPGGSSVGASKGGFGGAKGK